MRSCILKKNQAEGTHEIFWRREVMNIFINLLVVVASQIYAYVQTHQDVYIQSMQLFFVINYTSIKLKNI